jgi:hypothetical protein
MVRPRDNRGRFLKSTSEIPTNLFGRNKSPQLIQLKDMRVENGKIMHKK